jgi:magnesium-transporting ATPase (P-type)
LLKDKLLVPVISRKLFSAIASIIIVLVILDLLTTRQVLPYGTVTTSIMEIILFVLTVVVGYGIGSWILLAYTKKISTGLRTKSPFVRIMDLAVTITQFSLFGILLFVIYNNSVNCHDYFNLCNSNKIASTSVYAISSIAATIIMGLISFKFFSWYKVNNRNFIVLFYGLAAAALAISIAGDAFDKLLLIQVVVEETSPPGAVPQASFIYETFEKYHGEIQYKVVNPHTTTLYVVPTSNLNLYNQIIYWTSLAPYILTWAGTALLLAYYYKRKTGKLNFTFWVIISCGKRFNILIAIRYTISILF